MTRYFTLTKGIVLTIDERDNYYPDGKIVIKNNEILAIGSSDKVESRGKEINMKGKIILPGFVNTHTHSPSPLFRGMADDLCLMEWLKTLIWPAEKYMSEEIAYHGALLTFLEFLTTGVTTFADQYFYSEIIGEAARKSGLRGFVAPTIFSGPTPETSDPLQAAVNFIEKYVGREDETLIFPCIGPHAPYSCNRYELKQVVDISSRYDLLIQTHISETREENEQIFAKWGLTPTQYLDEIGLLERPLLAAHCIHLNEKDIKIFKKRGVRVSYNPVSNLKLVSGIMPFKKLRDEGIVLSLGTDGAQSNNSLDLLRDLKTGVLIQKYANKDATFLTAREALRLITINGAKALGIDDKIGSIEKGKKADIIALDMEAPNINPLHEKLLKNIYSAVVYSASGLNVSDVIVNGEILMLDKEIKKLDRQEIIKNAKKSSDYLMKKVGLL